MLSSLVTTCTNTQCLCLWKDDEWRNLVTEISLLKRKAYMVRRERIHNEVIHKDLGTEGNPGQQDQKRRLTGSCSKNGR